MLQAVVIAHRCRFYYMKSNSFFIIYETNSFFFFNFGCLVFCFLQKFLKADSLPILINNMYFTVPDARKAKTASMLFLIRTFTSKFLMFYGQYRRGDGWSRCMEFKTWFEVKLLPITLIYFLFGIMPLKPSIWLMNEEEGLVNGQWPNE